MAKPMDDLLAALTKADGGVSMSINDFKEAQYGIPLKHYCLQYLFGSTGLRYGGFYLLAGVPKSCKSPFGFFLGHLCCESEGIVYLFELEGKASPTLMSSMFADHPEWCDKGGTFRMIRGKTIDEAEKQLTKKVLPVFRNMKAYETPLLIDFDSISGAAASDVVDKINAEGTISRAFTDKSFVMKHLSENWMALTGNLPVVFVGVVQEKQAVDSVSMPGRAPGKTYGGGKSMLFKAGTLLSFGLMGQLPGGNGKLVRIKTAMSGFSDAREIETKFVWDQFGNLESESQGHKWMFAESTARCLANPKVVGELRDIIDVKLHDNGLVTCKNFGQEKVIPEEFEAALFAEENKETLNNLYRYQKIEIIKPCSEYPEFAAKLDDAEGAAKQAEKEAKAAERQKKVDEAKAKEEAKKQKKEDKLRKESAEAAKRAIEAIKAGKV